MPFTYSSVYLDNPIQPGRALDIFLPDRVTREIALFFVHGGGWAAGSRAQYHLVMRAFNAQGYICGSADYRLYNAINGISILDQLTDLRHAYDQFLTELDSLGRPHRIFTLGGSAGAHLNGLLTLAAPGDCGEAIEFAGRELRHPPCPPVGAAVSSMPPLFEPWEDIFPGIWDSMQLAMGVRYEDDPERYRRVAPIQYVSKTSCPFLILFPENEYMFPLRHQIQFQKKMQSLNRRCEIRTYTDAEHGFFYNVIRRQQKEALADVLAFIDSLDG
jgi:acetyl esterase/lipase